MFLGAFNGIAGAPGLGQQRYTPPVRTVPQNLSGTGAVLITFDDGTSDAYTLTYPLFAAHNIPATCYINSGTVGGASVLTPSMMRELDAAGWCMANHTRDHLDLTTLSQALQQSQIQKTVDDLTAWGVPDGALHVAYPFGSYNADTLAAMEDVSALSGRGVAFDEQFSLPLEDMHQIPAVRIRADTTLATAKGYIDTALANDTICCFYMHVIKSEGELDTYDWAYDDLAALVDYIVQTNIPVLTIADLYAVQSGARVIRQQY